MAGDTVHKFERAGLGMAPFKVVGFKVDRGPHRHFDEKLGVTVEVGAPGQPMGSCAYCATGIADCYKIRSADGKEFVVGNICVGKTGDAGLVSAAKRAAARSKRDRRHAQDDARIEAALEALEGVWDELAEKPHPHRVMAERGLTLADWAEFMLRRAGRAGGVKAARLIEKTAKAAGR